MSTRAAATALLCLLAGAVAWPARAQTPPTLDEMQALRAELDQLRAEERERAARIDAIEQRLNAMLGGSAAAEPMLLPTNAAEAPAPPEQSDRVFYEPIRGVVLASGEGANEDIGESWAVAHELGSKGIPNRVDPWGEHWEHDWPLWRAMLPQYLDELV